MTHELQERNEVMAAELVGAARDVLDRLHDRRGRRRGLRRRLPGELMPGGAGLLTTGGPARR